MANPVSIKRVIRSLKDRFPTFHYSLHLHNTKGMAFAVAVAVYSEGITDFDSSLAGFGGCPYAPNASGNIATEDLAHGFEEIGSENKRKPGSNHRSSNRFTKTFSYQSDSFILKAGKCSDLHLAPAGQN